MDNIDIYRNSSIITLREVPFIIYSWIIILMISFILFLSWSLLFKYKKYLSYESYVKNGYVVFYVGQEFFTIFASKEVIIINNKYKYTIIALEPYSYNMSEPDYWKVTMELSIPKEWVIENIRIILKFLDEETTFMKSIIKKIKKGFE